MDILKQSTAVTVVMGPMLDSTDGNTQETALTISQADIRLSKNGGSFAQSANAAGATHMEYGKYSVPLDTTDTGTLGRLRVDIHESGALPTWREFMIVPANVYDSAVLGTDKLEVDAIQLSNSAQSLLDLKDFADTGYDPATNKVQGVVLTDTCTTNTDVRGTDGANTVEPDAAGTLASYDPPTRAEATADKDAIIADLLTMKQKVAGTYDRETDSMEAIRDRGDAAWLTGAGGSAPTVEEIRTEMEEAGSSLASILADTTTDIPAKILKYTQLLARSDAAIATDNSTELTAINADGGSGAGDFSNQTDGIEAIRDRGDAAWLTGAGGSAPTVEEIRTEMEEAGSSLASILADTGTDGVAVAAGSKTGYTLSSVGVDAVHDDIIEGSLTSRQIQRIVLAASAGKVTGGGTDTIICRDDADSKARITATVDANGNRTAVTKDGT